MEKDLQKLLEDDGIEILIVDGEGKVAQKLESKVSIRNPYDFDISRFLPNSEVLTLNKFFEIAQKLIKDAQVREGVIDSKLVQLSEEYPPVNYEDFGTELICYKIVSRTPGMMNTKGTGRPHRKSNYYYEKVDPNYPNKSIIVESRPVDHIIEFTCYAKTNKLANKRAIWLEKLLINSSFAFEVSGAERFYWKERRSDSYISIGQQKIFSRPIHFFLRFREFEAKAESILRRLIIESTIGAGK